MRRRPFLVAAVTLSCAMCGTLIAQAEPHPQPPAQVPVMVRRSPFPSWDTDAHLASSPSSVAVVRDSSKVWWGLGVGATAGAIAGLALTQALCEDADGCTGRSIGAALAGTLIGGLLESAMKY